MTTVYWRGQLKGWFQLTKFGRWRALTPAGTLSYHDSSLAAMEALLCSA
jgi:hypothetical protein